MLLFEERGKPEFPEKNLSEQSREPTNSAHIWWLNFLMYPHIYHAYYKGPDSFSFALVSR